MFVDGGGGVERHILKSVAGRALQQTGSRPIQIHGNNGTKKLKKVRVGVYYFFQVFSLFGGFELV